MGPKKKPMVSLAMSASDRLVDASSGVRPSPETKSSAAIAAERSARLRRMVDDHIDFVARVLRNAGTPLTEIDDEVQRTFITAARRIDDVRVGSERGFLLQDEMLRSIGHPEVFVSGDCATPRAGPLPRCGVYALRQGQTLAASFRNIVQGQPPVAYRPQRHAMVLISCGRRYALAQRGSWSAQGRWVWWWKNHIDRKWLRSLSV